MMFGRLTSGILLATSLALSAAVVAVAPAMAQTPAVPDTPVGRQFSAWLAAFNSGEAERLGEYRRANYPSLTTPVDADVRFRRQTGGFELIEIESATDTELTARVYERNWPEAVGLLTISVEADAPHHVSGFGVRLTPAAPVARVNERDALAAFEARLDAVSDSGLFMGSVLIAKNGEPVFEYVTGLADRESGTPNTLETKFRNGSMNKMFTAVSILQLADAGRIRLDAPIGDYLADYPNTDLAARVTVEQLLTHTGGTGNIFEPEYFAQRLETRTHDDYVALFGARGGRFEPGSQFEYSNYGYVLLGAVIEAATGVSYYDYVDEHIFAPAGMTSTGLLPEDVDVPGRAIAYTAQGDGLQSAMDTLPYRGTAAGGGYSTVGDFVRFAEALQAGVLLSPEMVAVATSTQIANGPGVGYGYGFGEFDLNGVRSFGHSGGAPGMSAELRVLPDSGYEIAIASNMDGSMVSRLVQYVGARLPADP